MKISVGILAGSRAQGLNCAKVKAGNRMNISKLMEELDGMGDVLISAAKKEDYEELCGTVMEDSSLLKGLYNVISASGEDHIFVCGSDMPGISGKLVEYMSEFICSDYDCYCLTDESRIQPLCAIYSKTMLPLIEEAVRTGDHKLMNLLRKARVKYISLEYTCFGREILTNTVIRKPKKKTFPQAVFCVSGFKNSGKTFLITRLINEFIAEGYSVGVIKHDGHRYEMDRKGTDTYEFLRAGARQTAIFAAEQFSLNFRETASDARLLNFFSECGVVVIEGLKNSPYPKIEMTGSGGESVCDPKTLICIAAERDPRQINQIPVFDRDDIRGIFSCVKKYFRLGEK